MVNNMNKIVLIPVVLAALLAGCASTDTVASNDPARARAQAELAQAKADGTHPLTEAAYVYPNWVASHKAP